MKRAPIILGVLVLTVAGFAQQPDTSRNPDTYTRDNYNRPVDTGTGAGNWGLLGLLGLGGLLGTRRRETTINTRDEYTTEQQRRRAS